MHKKDSSKFKGQSAKLSFSLEFKVAVAVCKVEFIISILKVC
jgi:hypothetical protein